MLKRWSKFLLKFLLAIFVLFFVFLLFERIRGRVFLARYKRELISNGEKLTAKKPRIISVSPPASAHAGPCGCPLR